MTTPSADITLKDVATSVTHLATAFTDLATSVEDLAGMVARGFRDVTTRIDAFEERTEARFTNVEQKVDALTVDVCTLAYDHGRLKTHVEHLEESEFGSIQEP